MASPQKPIWFEIVLFWSKLAGKDADKAVDSQTVLILEFLLSKHLGSRGEDLTGSHSSGRRHTITGGLLWGIKTFIYIIHIIVLRTQNVSFGVSQVANRTMRNLSKSQLQTHPFSVYTELTTHVSEIFVFQWKDSFVSACPPPPLISIFCFIVFAYAFFPL